MTDAVDPSARFFLKPLLELELFKPPSKDLWFNLATIIQENSHLYGNRQKCLSFRGKFYWYDKEDRGTRQVTNILHKSLRERFKAYLEELEALERENDQISALVVNGLSIVSCRQDLYRVFPDCIHGLLRRGEDRMPVKESTLLQRDIDEFIQENDKYITMLKSRMTLNLLYT